MIEDIFQGLPGSFVPGVVGKEQSYYFSLGEIRKTVLVTPDSCSVHDGKTVEEADCVCKTSPEFFGKIWHEDYRPGMKDFMSGTIKSNNPAMLQDFLRSFGKNA